MGTSDRMSGDHAGREALSSVSDFRGGRFREAVRHLRKAVDANPANVDWRYDLAVALQKAERRRPSPSTGGSSTAGGGRPDALTNLALCLRALGHLHEAERAAERAAALAPGSAEALHNLGTILDALGRPGAIAILERAVDIGRGAPNVLNDLGVALDRAGELARAETCFRKAVEIATRLREARENLAGVALRDGEQSEAEASRRARRRRPAPPGTSAPRPLSPLLVDRAGALGGAALRRARADRALELLGRVLRDATTRRCDRASGKRCGSSRLPESVAQPRARAARGRAVRRRWRRMSLPGETALPEGAGEPRRDAASLPEARARRRAGPGDEPFPRYAPGAAGAAHRRIYPATRGSRRCSPDAAVRSGRSREEAPPAADWAVLVGDLPAILGEDEAARAAVASSHGRARAGCAASGSGCWRPARRPTSRRDLAGRTGIERWEASSKGAFFKGRRSLLGSALRACRDRRDRAARRGGRHRSVCRGRSGAAPDLGPRRRARARSR
jgi:Flp pilus assembly protein TadD